MIYHYTNNAGLKGTIESGNYGSRISSDLTIPRNCVTVLTSRLTY